MWLLDIVADSGPGRGLGRETADIADMVDDASAYAIAIPGAFEPEVAGNSVSCAVIEDTGDLVWVRWY